MNWASPRTTNSNTLRSRCDAGDSRPPHPITCQPPRGTDHERWEKQNHFRRSLSDPDSHILLERKTDAEGGGLQLSALYPHRAGDLQHRPEGIAKISRGDKAEETAVQPPADADAAENSPDALPDTIKPVITKETVVTLLVVCIAAIAYIMLINWIGYILSTVLFIAGVLVYLRVRKPWLVAAVSIGVTAFLYIMFNNILMVQLPVGRLLYNILYR